MKILLLTNLNNEESEEDIWIANTFKKDGNIVDISWIDYDEALDNEYDIFIKRNIWLDSSYCYEKILRYEENANKLNDRLKGENKKIINFNGNFDGQGKQYLIDLYNRGYEVIPSIDKKQDFCNLPEAEKYLAAAQSLSYLYMPVMQAEDPHPERKRKDRGALPEVRHYVYQKELMQGTCL